VCLECSKDGIVVLYLCNELIVWRIVLALCKPLVCGVVYGLPGGFKEVWFDILFDVYIFGVNILQSFFNYRIAYYLEAVVGVKLNQLFQGGVFIVEGVY
jgi:hypothetical protein